MPRRVAEHIRAGALDPRLQPLAEAFRSFLEGNMTALDFTRACHDGIRSLDDDAADADKPKARRQP